MYLAIMLVVISALVFYNEINSKMNIAEIALLAIALIAIIRASMNYIRLDDTIEIEKFTNRNNSGKSNIKSRGKNNKEDTIVLNSNSSSEYFDTDVKTPKHQNNFNSANSTKSAMNPVNINKVSPDAVNQINSLLGLKSNFEDIPQTTQNGTSTDNEIDSVYLPQIIIGKGVQDSLHSTTTINSGEYAFNINSLLNNATPVGTAFSEDNMTFNNTMKPKTNLWNSSPMYDDPDTNWTQSLNDFNNGKWNPQLYKKPSDYTDYYTPRGYGTSTPSSTTSTTSTTSRSNFYNLPSTTTPETPTPTTLDLDGQPRKLCGAYDDLSMEQGGNLVVRNYTHSKKWMPGYTYVPPVYWDVPQRHTSACQVSGPNVQKLTGLVDRGLPLNVLELNPDGTQSNTENSLSLTNVGSILPRFNYQEEPYSSPYI